MQKGTFYLIVGASGSGKDTVICRTVSIIGRVFVPIKYTTRKPRKGEMKGREYHFVSERRFKRLKLFAKYTVYGASYGVGMKLLEKLEQGYDVFLNISNQLTYELKSKHQPTKIVFVFVSLKNLKQRMLQRGRDDDHEIEQRLQRAKENLNFLGNADFILNNNGKVKETVGSFVDYIIWNRLGNEFKDLGQDNV